MSLTRQPHLESPLAIFDHQPFAWVIPTMNQTPHFTGSENLANRVRRFAALGILLAWLVSFFLACPGGWDGSLQWIRPQSQHWLITLVLTGGPAIIFAILLWPCHGGIRWGAKVLVVLCVAAEVLARWFPVNTTGEVVLFPEQAGTSSRLYRGHHYTLLEPLPDIYTPDGLIHNRLGFRDQRPLQPDPNAIRLVFIGGNTVYGAMTRDNNELFTRRLDDLLNAEYREQLGTRHFEVINAGMADATSAETLLRLIFAVSEAQPALVAVQLGISDIWPRVVSDDYRGDFGQLRKAYGHGQWCCHTAARGHYKPLAEEFARSAIYRSALLDRWLGNRVPSEPLLELTNHTNFGSRDRLKTNPPVYYRRNLLYLVSLIRAQGAQPVLISDAMPVYDRPDTLYSRGMSEHSPVMAEVAKLTQVPFLDLATALPLTDDIRVGDKYLNAEGQLRLAKVLETFFSEHHVIDGLLRNPKPQ